MMVMLWNMEKGEREKRLILFQEEDKDAYIFVLKKKRCERKTPMPEIRIPDYGMYLKKNMPNLKEVSFTSIHLDHVRRIESGRYATAFGKWGEGKYRAVTIVLDEVLLAQLLGAMDKKDAERIREYFKTEPEGTERLMFSSALPANVETRLGTRTKSPTGMYIPFIAISISKRSDEELKRDQQILVLADELFQIARTDGFLSHSAGGKFNEGLHNIRAQEIGETLYAIGGKDVITAVHRAAIRKVGGAHARHLEIIWGNIGDWLH
jgi:hypothetical protein